MLETRRKRRSVQDVTEDVMYLWSLLSYTRPLISSFGLFLYLSPGVKRPHRGNVLYTYSRPVILTQQFKSSGKGASRLYQFCHRRRLRGVWGTVPQKNLRWGRPMHPSPHIWRSSVMG